ncbi:hypothetical protein M3226_30220 [Neobacillus cucumis]|uniref:hypothetical protein n=1 Tax=Neobacillus cucumis TaxID=1740721 RepID=UPI0020414CCA|nr:hypothetical protein [Neobacillus cucumis]MCM3729810.1 hypothetical protein [Neobacillus cucumis]
MLSYKNGNFQVKGRYCAETFFGECPVSCKKCPVKIKIGRHFSKRAGIFAKRQVLGSKWQVRMLSYKKGNFQVKGRYCAETFFGECPVSCKKCPVKIKIGRYFFENGRYWVQSGR